MCTRNSLWPTKILAAPKHTSRTIALNHLGSTFGANRQPGLAIGVNTHFEAALSLHGVATSAATILDVIAQRIVRTPIERPILSFA